VRSVPRATTPSRHLPKVLPTTRRAIDSVGLKNEGFDPSEAAFLQGIGAVDVDRL
jgi:hypothetical protein